MKLIYSIPNKIYYIQNFLDHSTYKKLHYDVFRNNLIKLNSTKETWDKNLMYGYKNNVKNSELSIDYNPIKKILILLKTNLFCKLNFKKFVVVMHSMEDNSGINWHSDGDFHEYGITYYINRRWNEKFGGEFLFKDINCNGFIPLVGNSLVIIKTPLQHKVTPVMKSIVPRKTIQIFINKEEDNNE